MHHGIVTTPPLGPPLRMYELNLGENPWPKEMYTRCDVKCQYFVSFAQDSFLATELSLGLETIMNDHGSV